MGGFSSPIAAGGGGGDQQGGYDPAQYLNGAPGQSQPGGAQQGGGTGTSPDFVQSMSQIGMQLEQQIDTLASQFPDGSEEARAAKMAVKKLIAKVLTTSSRTAGGPMAPRMA